MALQDLTPQLRTRLSRVERAVGWFILIAIMVLLAGFGYYLHNTAQRKGWFDKKVYYRTSLNNAAGIKEHDPVKLMGFNVGEITKIQTEAPDAYFGITVSFWIKEPYYGYIWLDSRVRIAPSDFLGNRFLEIVKGKTGEATVKTDPKNKTISILHHDLVRAAYKNLVAELTETAKKASDSNVEDSEYNPHTIAMEATNQVNQMIKAQPEKFYSNVPEENGYWIAPLESPALTDRLEALVLMAEGALPNFLKLTNQVSGLLTNATTAAAEAQNTMANAQRVVSNLNVITANLKDPHGSLGEWLIPTNLHAQLESTVTNANATLASARATLDSADTNLTTLATQLDSSLINLANLTSNLNSQVAANTNLVENISKAIVDTDDLIQGLKRHWLLRSAFKKKSTNQVDKIQGDTNTLVSPKAK